MSTAECHWVLFYHYPFCLFRIVVFGDHREKVATTMTGSHRVGERLGHISYGQKRKHKALGRMFVGHCFTEGDN